jgi:hypothetical protein
VTIACACRPRQFALLLRKSGQPVVRAHAAGSSVTREPGARGGGSRAPRDALAVLPIIVIGTKLWIGRVIREDMVRRTPESMGYRHDGFLGTAVPEDPSETRLQRAVFYSARPRGRFDEHRAQPAVALSRLAGLVLPGTLMGFPDRGRPRSRGGRAAKRAHVHTGLRDDDRRSALIDPGNAIQRVSASANGAITVSTPSAQNPDGFVQIVEVR